MAIFKLECLTYLRSTSDISKSVLVVLKEVSSHVRQKEKRAKHRLEKQTLASKKLNPSANKLRVSFIFSQHPACNDINVTRPLLIWILEQIRLRLWWIIFDCHLFTSTQIFIFTLCRLTLADCPRTEPHSKISFCYWK